MADIAALLSPSQKLCLERERAEVVRLYRLPDRWLAEALLRLARTARSDFPLKLGDPMTESYEAGFVWHVVPELAKRLGATRLLPNEASNLNIQTMDGYQFRVCVGSYLKNVNIGRWSLGSRRERDMPTPGEILCHDPTNGNPVAFAVDRLYSAPEPDDDREDHLARYLRKISKARGYNPTPYWTPDLVLRNPIC